MQTAAVTVMLFENVANCLPEVLTHNTAHFNMAGLTYQGLNEMISISLAEF